MTTSELSVFIVKIVKMTLTASVRLNFAAIADKN